MNLENLKTAQSAFLQRYPGGFENPEMLAIGKKHNIAKLTATTQAAFAEDQFYNLDQIIAAMVTTVSRSSMVSMFEKPKFRDFTKVLHDTEKEALASALYEQLHGDEEKGFEQMVSLLQVAKLAKWTLISVIPFYYRPEQEVFVKPMTTKGIIKQLQLDLTYKPLPSWEFYSRYRAVINTLKTKADASLSPNNAAFCGFLMMTQ